MKRLDRSVRARSRPVATAKTGSVVAEAEYRPHEIGARGDAVAAGPAGPVYLPYALPGETVRARVAGERGEVVAVIEPSGERVAPPCKHFGRCGGCQLQHWADGPMLAWKREQVVRALERRGVEAEVAPIQVAWGAGRRRAAFHAVRGPKGVRFGFIARGGGAVVNLEQCPVLEPALGAAAPALAALGARYAPSSGEAILATLLTEAGLDVDIKGAGGAARFDREGLEAAAEAAEAADLARLSFEGEILVARRQPVLTMGRARVTPPPGAFLQPTVAGEALLAALALEAIAGAKRAVDLFCGVGTFALRMAETMEVHAVEGEADHLVALKRAADALAGGHGVTTERRDLLRAPVSALELKRFDAAVFDPPRSGARLQAEQIGRSKVSRVAAVSCDPATFARDAKALIEAGFRLTALTPVDQFRWSPHVEVVGAFER